MRNASKKRQKWLAKYRAKAAADDLIQTCPVCGERELKTLMDRHHTNGRATLSDLLTYIYVHRKCHDKIHQNGKWARENGFLRA